MYQKIKAISGGGVEMKGKCHLVRPTLYRHTQHSAHNAILAADLVLT